MVEDQTASLVTAEFISHEPSQGRRSFHVYEPPPKIDDDRNSDDEHSSFSGFQADVEVALPYVHHPVRVAALRTSFRTLQAWEGVVTAVAEESFAVKLVDLISNKPDEEADIDFEDVSKDERPLVRIGAVFLLHVGYATSEGGQRSRTAILRFRRLPVWTESELSSARKAAQEQADTIRWQ